MCSVAAMLAAAAFACSTACAQPVTTQSTELSVWYHRLVDTQRRMTAYIIRLDSLRDSIEVRGASARKVCDPAGMRDLHGPINQDIARLVAEAPSLSLGQDAMHALRRLEKNWASIQALQASRWEEVNEIKSIEPKELCLRAGDLVAFRMEMADDQATLAKAVADALARK